MNPEDWIEIAAQAWNAGEHHQFEDALRFYAQAESHLIEGMTFSPSLNLLRHAAADEAYMSQVTGSVMTLEPTEDSVLGIEGTSYTQPSDDAWGMTKTEINQDRLEENLKDYHFNPGFHYRNLRSHQPHVLVMSTGRCGTMSLYRLLQQTKYLPYHQYYYNTSWVYRLEQMCRHIEGNYDEQGVTDFWMKTRAAEWLGAVLQDRPMAAVNHHDTIFAPTFAMLHPASKIIYLRRNPRDVFASMYGKRQWGDKQLRPIFYHFGDKGWEWKAQGLDMPEQIVWYLKFTEAFSRALGSVLGDRWAEFSSDKLFAQDPEECGRLSAFLDLDIHPEQVVEHFGTVYNRKAHKAEAVEKGLEIFEEIYEKM